MAGIKNLRDKVVVITGAGSGIGRATAKAFAAEGADLIIADQHEDRLLEVAGEIGRLGGRALHRAVDVSDRAQVEGLAKFAMDELGRVDILFSNAGVSIGGSFVDTSIEDFQWIFSINFWGGLYCLKAFLPHMLPRKQGHIVLTSSVLGLAATPGVSAYCATKFAVAGLGESIRAELRQHGIGVSIICPGVINTKIVSDGRMYTEEGSLSGRANVEKFYTRGWPPERVAKAVLRAVRRNSSVVPVGPEAWLMWLGKRLCQRGHEMSSEMIGRYLTKPGK